MPTARPYLLAFPEKISYTLRSWAVTPPKPAKFLNDVATMEPKSRVTTR